MRVQRGTIALVCLTAAACAGSAGSVSSQPSSHPGDWSCVAGEANDMPRASVQPSGSFELSLQDAITSAPVGRADLAVCARDDEDCARPLSQGGADDMGRATLSAPGGPASFDGFVRVSRTDVLTHYAFLPGRVPSCPTCPIVLPLYTPSAVATTTQQTGTPFDPSRAWVRVDLQDCAGAPAKDATVSIGSFGCADDGGATPAVTGPPFVFGPQHCARGAVAYATGGRGAVSRTALATDATGVALGLGVAAGPLGVAELLDRERVAGAIGFARAGAVSTFVVRP